MQTLVMEEINFQQAPQAQPKASRPKAGKPFRHYQVQYKIKDNDMSKLFRGIDKTTTNPVLIKEFEAENKLSWK